MENKSNLSEKESESKSVTSSSISRCSSNRSKRFAKKSYASIPDFKFERMIDAAKETMIIESNKIFEQFDQVFERHISELEETRRQIRISTHNLFTNMKERHITEMTELEIDHVLEREKAIQHPSVQENQLKIQAQNMARRKDLQEAVRLRDEAIKIRSIEKEQRARAVDQKYFTMLQRLVNKQKSEIIKLQDQMIIQMEAAQAATNRKIFNIQKKTVACIKNVLSRAIASGKKELRNSAKNHEISQVLTDCMNDKIRNDNRVGIFYAVQI
ncbi:hypothetical protein TRFO_30335 [Tritrichomonas foetus]|uniref:Uncharacterized protein n=1 Tax=Tritrichomonas foetus TaxID=1144522 RepID=A0A1J4JTQ5_9EUKA|nr:hypothetical protein TRFO_30335 [Tritrichomonas foetus]|eukprot:OHT02505.1 hypothetical protein TRFO_30335 [Tritrichomonas foetus]